MTHSSQSPPPFDYQKALDEFESDTDFLNEVIQGFFQRLPAQLVKIQKAIANKDGEKVRKTCHAIKGAAANLAAAPLADAAYRLEMIGKANALDDSQKAFKKMLTEIERFEAYFNSLNG